MTTFCCAVESGKPDELGRQRFTLYWAGMVGRAGDQHGVRGQCFFASVEEYRKLTRNDGHRFVDVKSRDEAERIIRDAGELP